MGQTKNEPQIARSREEIQSVLIDAEITQNRADADDPADGAYASGIVDFWRWVTGYTHESPKL